MAASKSDVDEYSRLLRIELENTVYVCDNQTNIYGDVYNISGDLTIANDEKYSSSSDLIPSIADDLRKHYLNNLCKKPIYPWMPDKYIDLESIYVPVTIDIEIPGARSIKQRVDLYQDLFKSNERCTRHLLCGNPGQGKSSFCAKLAYDWCTGATLQNIQLLFVLQLGLMDHESNIEDEICSQLLSIDLNSRTLVKVIGDLGGAVLLVLDGLDEAPPNLMKQEAIGNLTKVLRHKHLRDCRVLVTTRPWRERDVTQIPAYKRLELQRMTKTDVETFVRKFFGQNEDDFMMVKLGKELIKLIRGNKLYFDTSTPLVALLLCWYWSETNGKTIIPERIGELYYQMICLMCEKNRDNAEEEEEEQEPGYLVSILTQVIATFFPIYSRSSQSRQDDLIDELGKLGAECLTPKKTKIMFTEDEIKIPCGGEHVLQKAQETGIICQKGSGFWQFFHKSGQEYCAGNYLANHPDRLLSYLKHVKNMRDALSLAPVLKFTSTSRYAARMILQRLMQIFDSEIRCQEYYDEKLPFDDSRPVQHFIELCLECNFEADAKTDFVSILRPLFHIGSVLFYGIVPKASVSLAYFMTFCDPEAIRCITIRSIPHSSHPFINIGPTYEIYSAALQGLKDLSTEKIQQINDKFKATHPNLHPDWSNFSPAQLAAYVSCTQACEDLPSSSQTNIVPIINSLKHVKLERLDVSNFQLGDNFNHLLDTLEKGSLKSLLLINARSTASEGHHMTRLAANMHQLPLLESLDVSWNKAEEGQTFQVLTNRLRDCRNLKILYVNNMQAPASDMLILAQNVPAWLTLLSVHGNEMDDSVASCFMHTLPRTLTTLFISVKNLQKNKHGELLESISQKLTRLQELRIWDSPYPANLIQYGSHTLTTCAELKSLVLQSTCDDLIRDTCLEICVHGLQQAKDISRLSLYGISLQKDGFERLVDVARRKRLPKLQFHRRLLPEGVDAQTLDDFVTLG